jgi:hypothetical protein
MTTSEFQTAFSIANSESDLSGEDTSHFNGFALSDYEPRSCTVRQLAALMRWQALLFNGKWDMDALEDIRHCGRRKFIVLDGAIPSAVQAA